MATTFGPYQLIEKIAQGGMAEVFLASRKGEIGGFTRQVAIKRIYQHLAEDPELITMFFDEARIAALLNHPNIVQIYDLGQIDGYFYIAMEFVHGRDLRSLAERGLQVSNFIPLPLAVKVLAEAAAGLHYAHTRAGDSGQPLNIVHRDVSPQNILIAMNGSIKVCDFGIAKAEERLTHTRTGQFKGKFAYMSPEQVIGDGQHIDLRSDIFSLGIVLYEITVCTRLFRGKNDYDTIRMVAEADVAPPTQVRRGFPPELERIILKALARRPEDRYQSAQQMQMELEEWLLEQRAKTSPVHVARYMAQVFPELLETPGGISEDATVERNVAELVSGAQEYLVGQKQPPQPDTSIATNPLGNNAASSPQPARSPDDPTREALPAQVAQDFSDYSDSDADATGELNINRFKEALAQDQFSPPEHSYPPGEPEYTPAPSRDRNMTPMAQPSAIQDVQRAYQQQQPAAQISGQWAAQGPAHQPASPQTSGQWAAQGQAQQPQHHQPASPQTSGQWAAQGHAHQPQQPQGLQQPSSPQTSGQWAAQQQWNGAPQPQGLQQPSSPQTSGQWGAQQRQPAQQQQWGEAPQQGAPSGPWPQGAPPTAQPQNPSGQWASQPRAPSRVPNKHPSLQGAPVGPAASRGTSPGTPQPTPTSPSPQGGEGGDEWDPGSAGLSMRYDIAELKKGNTRKVMLLIVALLVIGGIGAAVVMFGPERDIGEIDEGNKIDPALLEVPPPEPLARVGVDLATSPEGAHVVINGILAEGTTPGSFELAEGKVNEVLFFKEGHLPVTAYIDGKRGGGPEDALELPEADPVDEGRVSSIVVESEPLGAMVFHNGVQIGPAPVTLRQLDPDVLHHVHVESKGFYSYSALVQPVVGSEDKVRALLDPESLKSRVHLVDLSLETLPRGAMVQLNGEGAGVSPTLKNADRHKHYEVTFEATGYKKRTHYLETREGGTVLLRPRLEAIKREKGKVSVSIPSNTAQIYLGSNSYGDKPIKKLELAEGSYPLVIENTDGDRLETRLEVVPGKHTRYKAEILNGELRARKLK